MSKKEILGGALVLVIFAAALLGADEFEKYAADSALLKGQWGMLAYVGIAFCATVLAPLTAMPLMPLASVLWGPLLTALLSIVGWTLGAVAAFLIARTFGRPFAERCIDLSRAEALTQKLVGHNTFWQLVLLRMLVPVDLLSYAVGLLVPISVLRFTLATLLGVTPFAFLFAYTNVLPGWAQVVVVGGAFATLVVIYLLSSAKHEKIGEINHK